MARAYKVVDVADLEGGERVTTAFVHDRDRLFAGDYEVVGSAQPYYGCESRYQEWEVRLQSTKTGRQYNAYFTCDPLTPDTVKFPATIQIDVTPAEVAP